jgi:hypothetical protein
MNKHFKDIKATVSVTEWRLEQLRRDGFNAATLTSYLHDNAVRVLNGHRADQGITVISDSVHREAAEAFASGVVQAKYSTPSGDVGGPRSDHHQGDPRGPQARHDRIADDQ